MLLLQYVLPDDTLHGHALAECRDFYLSLSLVHFKIGKLKHRQFVLLSDFPCNLGFADRTPSASFPGSVSTDSSTTLLSKKTPAETQFTESGGGLN